MRHRLAEILAVNKESLDTLRSELSGMRSHVEGEKQDLLVNLAELTRRMVESLSCLEVGEGEEEEARQRSLEKEREVEAVRQQLDTELARVGDCHREIDTYRSQLEDALRALDGAKGELAETKEEGEARVEMERKERERMVKEVGEKAEGELKELKQRLELEHELELDSYKQQLETGESDRHSALVAELEETRRKEKEKEEELAELKAKTELFDVSCEEKIAEEKEKIVAILEAGFSERQRMALQELEAKLAEEHRYWQNGERQYSKSIRYGWTVRNVALSLHVQGQLE